MTSAVEDVQPGLEIVQRTTTGPVPVEWVNVALGVVAFGLNDPAPPLTTDQAPLPTEGVLPPNPADVPPEQIVCEPPTMAVVGPAFTVALVIPAAEVQPATVTVTE